jgi:hypothetical protein
MHNMVHFLHMLTHGDCMFNSCLTTFLPHSAMAGFVPAIFFFTVR